MKRDTLILFLLFLIKRKIILTVIVCHQDSFLYSFYIITFQLCFYYRLADVFGNNTKPSEEDLYDFWCGYCRKEGYMNSGDILEYINERATNNIRWREALQRSPAPVHVIYGPADPVNPRPFIDFYK